MFTANAGRRARLRRDRRAARLLQNAPCRKCPGNVNRIDWEAHMLALIIQSISGAVGGNLAGSLMKNNRLGPLGNSIAGVLGGAAGGQLLGLLVPALASAASGGGMD